MRFLLFVGFVLLSALALSAQESKLANEYYKSGEYEKAATLYEKIYKKNAYSEYYFNRYIECLLALEEYERAQKSIQEQLKKNPKNVYLYVQSGNILEQLGDTDKAQKQFDKSIKNLSADRNVIYNLGNSFVRLAKYDYGIAAYEKGSELMSDPKMFASQKADIYRRQGETELMISSYLSTLNDRPNSVANLQNIFTRILDDEQFDILKAQLYEKMQDEPDIVQYPEMLEWVFIQKKEYKKALRQAKSLDRRLDEDGTRVYKLAAVAENDKDYDTARTAYEYITTEKGPTSSYYLDAQQSILSTKKKQVLNKSDYTTEDLESLRTSYNEYLDQVGRDQRSAAVISELALLEAYYLRNVDGGISLLENMINMPGVNAYIQANGKLSLGDLYLIKDEIWESTLLYSQVDKQYREDYLGELARFKNAKLSYYNGDFGWAQTQFDILKASTSKLISNDAIDLSVFITDNMGLDTTEIPLQMYADTELLTFQNRYDEALEKLDALVSQYPDHTLEDDIYYAKAHIYIRQNMYEPAIDMYNKIITDHADEIRCDNALIELARVYDYRLDDPDQASELYERLFIDYSNSTFAIEARKRYRELRGDDI